MSDPADRYPIKEILANVRLRKVSAIDTIRSLATTKKIPDREADGTLSSKKVAIMFINSYLGTSKCLDDGPANDGIVTYNMLKGMGYTPYLYFDPTRSDFRTIFKTFISCEFDRLAFYYSGHGTYTGDRNGDEADGRDECLVFKDGNVVDDEIAATINTYNKCKKMTLIADCCHSGTIFDMPASLRNVTTLSAARDNEYAAQVTAEHKECGIFTYYLWKLYPECKNNVKTLATLINKKIEWANHQCIYNHDDADFL